MNPVAWKLLRSLALSETRRFARQHHGRWVALLAGAVFALLLMQLDLFLFIDNFPYPVMITIYPWNGQLIWWNFPALVMQFPWVQVILPIYPGISIALSTILAAIGSAAAFVALLRIRKGSRDPLSPAAAAAITLLGLSCLMAPLAMEGPAYWAYWNAPVAYTGWVYAWYLYPLQVLADFGMLLVLEHTLNVMREARETPGTSRPG